MIQSANLRQERVFEAANLRLYNALSTYVTLIRASEAIYQEFIKLISRQNDCVTSKDGALILTTDNAKLRRYRAAVRRFESTCKRQVRYRQRKGLRPMHKAIVTLHENVFQAYQRLIDNDPRLCIQWVEAREALEQCANTLSFDSLCVARQKICQLKADCKRRDARIASLAANPVLGFQLG